ncbi:hypothetical protein [Actinoplanes sp. URMC 104]|uniref:hypothetical protein n=1 Tax=Actinoplanes sp. URMC 104 TaxID=3423409 RepID=UPI003F1BC998
MTHPDAEAWLTQEADDLLSQGPFGLYEFVWGLRGTDFGLTDAQARELAARVARRIVDAGRARIFAVTWPALEVVEGPLDTGVLDEHETWSPGRAAR